VFHFVVAPCVVVEQQAEGVVCVIVQAFRLAARQIQPTVLNRSAFRLGARRQGLGR
jgi:hypothetical protein